MPLIIHTPAAMARALAGPLDSAVRRLLALRGRQNNGDSDFAHFVVAQAGDAIADVRRAIGFPLLLHDYADPPEPTWEWAERHDGGAWEAAFVLSDDGPALVLVVSEHDADTELMALLQQHAADDLERQHATTR